MEDSVTKDNFYFRFQNINDFSDSKKVSKESFRKSEQDLAKIGDLLKSSTSVPPQNPFKGNSGELHASSIFKEAR